MKVIVCENYDEMSAKAFEVMKELLDAKKDAVLGLATGSSPVGLYKEMIQYHKDGYSFIQVKTVKMGMYEDYDCTNRFYISLGFKEFEVLNSLWDENNPCQIYVMGI